MNSNAGPVGSARQPEGETLLGPGSEFEGKLTFEGTVRIVGKFHGEIFSEGTLVVGEGAKVEATVTVDTVIIQGHVIGDVKAKAGVELHAPGRLQGNLQAGSLVIQKGGVFDGHCTMQTREPARPVTPPPPAP
jgi:cytoskeletal protein CcmA (bactofilin family)